jgi:hypothetical protein
MAMKPGVVRNAPHPATDHRTARHAGYAKSQRRRKLVKEALGWSKTIGTLARAAMRGLPRIAALVPKNVWWFDRPKPSLST